MKKIMHLITWGTIWWCVPEYSEVEDLANLFNDYIDIKKYIVYSMKIYWEYSEKIICKKDSREIIKEDRDNIINEIKSAYSNWISLFLITHWTYTMADTAVYIEKNLDKKILDNISVVLTGSMYPWNVVWSDAPMNIWASLFPLLNNEKSFWVKICMHWKIWDPNKLEKDTENLIFREK